MITLWWRPALIGLVAVAGVASGCSEGSGADQPSGRRSIDVPNVVGRDEETAVRDLQIPGVRATVTRGACIPASQRGPEYAGPPSQVVRQEPDAGPVAEGTTVRLTVASAPC